MRGDDTNATDATDAADSTESQERDDDTTETDASAAEPAGDQPTVTIGAEGFEPGGERGAESRGDARAGTTAGLENAVPVPTGGFDWRGWVLVGVVVVAFIVVPVLVTVRPVWIGGFRTTYLVLPLVPAVLLGATAVWVALRSRQGER